MPEPISDTPESVERAASLTLGVIIPVFNEAACLEQCLSEILRRHDFDEIIVVDGGSTDASVEIVCKLMSFGAPDARAVPCLFQAARGRAKQLHAGAQAAATDVLLFLHADTALPPDAIQQIGHAIRCGHLWGRFEVQLSGRNFLLRIVERLMNWRSAFSGIVTGDQAMFVRRDVYRLLGGFAPMALMEDIEFSGRLKWLAQPARLPGPVITSSQRWEQHGVIRTILLMWNLRFLYWLGVSPERLARWYYR